ncbi:MAG TPA: tryptophan synthase subunit alpha [Nitrosopumilaceae archaeon]|nr:tryptophan synthase subunit alpha [Nitrosopumilaceae archaeon]
MSKIENKFKELRSKNEKALIAYIMVGYPNCKSTLPIVRGLVKGGADIIEIGFPFSDPLADGPVIQNASTVSLNKGTSIDDFFSLIQKIRKETDIPLVLMTYTNILYHKGYAKFIFNAKRVGIDGVILPDMSIEESKEYVNAAKKYNIDTIFLVSPNTNKNRLKKIAKICSGFLYLVSMFGTTGMKTTIQQYTINAIKNTKKVVNSKIPVGIGFGVTTPDDVKKFVSNNVDAVIVGSAFLRLIEKTPTNQLEAKVTSFTKKMKASTKAT